VLNSVHIRDEIEAGVLDVEEAPNVRKGFSICTILVLASLSLAAQGHRPPNGSVPGSAHGNAPSGPTAGEDRDTGKERAEDVGKGKKEGLEGDQGKKKGHKKHQKEQLKPEGTAEARRNS
jgi:hypothetical protein